MMVDKRKVRGRGAYGYIESKWVFNAKKETSRRRLTRQVYYHVYGDKERNPQQVPRGHIYDQSGEVQRYGDYKNWALGQSRRQNYVYRTHISPKGHVLRDADFVSAIRAASQENVLFKEFRLVIHRDTENAHAHMLFASQRQWRRAELEAWKVAVRQQLMQLEQIRCEALGIELPGVKMVQKVEKGREKAAETAPTRSTGKRRRRRRRRQKPQHRNSQQTIRSQADDGSALDM